MKSKTLSPAENSVSHTLVNQAPVNQAAEAVTSWNRIRTNAQNVIGLMANLPGFILPSGLYNFLKSNNAPDALLNMYLGVKNNRLHLYCILQDSDAELFENPNLPKVIIHELSPVSDAELVQMGFLTDFPFQPTERSSAINTEEAWRRVALWNICKNTFIQNEIRKTPDPSDEEGFFRVFEARISALVEEFECMGNTPGALLALLGIKQDSNGNTVSDLSFWATQGVPINDSNDPGSLVTDFTTPKPPFGVDKQGQKLYPKRFGLSRILQ